MYVAALRVELHIADSHSLKAKRAVVRPIVEGVRNRFRASAAEVDAQDTWQRATLGIATVGSSVAQVRTHLDAIERFIWSFPEVEVLSISRHWLEDDD